MYAAHYSKLDLCFWLLQQNPMLASGLCHDPLWKRLEYMTNWKEDMDGYTWDKKEGQQYTDRATSTADFVPFQAVDRRDNNVDPSQIVFPELFHPLLRHSGLVSGFIRVGRLIFVQNNKEVEENGQMMPTIATVLQLLLPLPPQKIVDREQCDL